MSISRKHHCGRAALIGLSAIGLIVSGCQWLPEERLPRLLRLSGDDPAAASPEDARAFAAEDRAVLARHSDADQACLWIRTIARDDDEATRPATRWRYPALDDLLSRPPEKCPDLHGYLRDDSSTVVANAAIGLARLGDDAGTDHLADAVRASSFPAAMRCAAAEALASLPGKKAVERLRELTDQYGRPGPGYQPKLHEELLRGLARRVDRADDQRFVAALESSSAAVLVAALEALADQRRGELPPGIIKLTTHADASVRGTAMRILAQRRHPEALKRLRAGLNDHDVRVRIEAIAALGRLGGTEPQAILRRLLETSPHDRIRAEAVTALGLLGGKEPVLDAIDDESWQVRQRVARALGRFPDRDSIDAAGKLLDDSSVRVQTEVLGSLNRWPLELAGPILIETLDNRCLATRHAATDQLAARWDEASDLDDGVKQQISPDRVDALRTAFQRRFGGIDRDALSRALAAGPAERSISATRLDRIEQIVLGGDVAQLAEFGPELVPALERIVFDRKRALPESVYRQVLPRHEPEYTALDRIDMSDVRERRRATATLATLAGEKPLSRLAGARLYQLVCDDPDQLVWQNALRAVEGNPHEPAIRLAYAAAGHPSPEVRRRACDNLAACPRPGHAPVLLATLNDKSDPVVGAAVHALGALGRIDDTGPLRNLMTATNENVRVETAIALARLGDETGVAALERLAYSADPKIQHRVVVAMGELPDPAFVPILVRLLDAKMAVSRGALRSLPKVLGRDVAVEDGRPVPTTTERIQQWKRWYYRQASAEQPNRLRSF